MKTLRLFTIVLLAVLVISTWAPAPAYAKPSGTVSTSTASLVLDLAKTKLAKLSVNNRTGGTLYVRLSGPRSYSFAASKQGKSVFSNIQPGRYTITVSTSACSGSLTYNKNVKGTTGLKAFVCKKKK